MKELIESITGGLAVGLAFAGPPLIIMIAISKELRKEKKNEK